MEVGPLRSRSALPAPYRACLVVGTTLVETPPTGSAIDLPLIIPYPGSLPRISGDFCAFCYRYLIDFIRG